MHIFVYDAWGKPRGPYTLNDILRLLESGEIGPEDKAWFDESDEKVLVRELPGLIEKQSEAGSSITPPSSPQPTGQSPISSASESVSPSSSQRPPPPSPPKTYTSDSFREKQPEGFRYLGQGGEFFKLNLVNILLTLVTLGIYSFWAKASVRSFHWNNTYFMDDHLEYHATGKELFIGFLKGMVIILPVVLLLYFLLQASGLEDLLGLVFFLIYLSASPFIVYSNRKFLLARTSWRNVRLKFHGTLGECYSIHLKGFLLIPLTLGFYTPWFIAELEKYFINNTSYGTERFDYQGNGGDLLGIYAKGMILTMLTFGIYSFWMQAELDRYRWNNTSVQGVSFINKIPGEELFVNTLLMLVAIYITFGIAFPWVIVRLLRIKASYLSMATAPDLAAIEAAMRDQKASSLGEGLNEAAEAIGDFLGG